MSRPARTHPQLQAGLPYLGQAVVNQIYKMGRLGILGSLLGLALFFCGSQALEFEMQTQTKCVYEEINQNVIVVGNWNVFHKDHPDQPENADVVSGATYVARVSCWML